MKLSPLRNHGLICSNKLGAYYLPRILVICPLLGLCCASAARVLCQPRPPLCTHHVEENQVSLPASDVSVLGEPLKLPALARHGSNHLRELSYNRRSQ